MVSITERAHQLIQDVVQPGDTVVDATIGNGHDTLFLAQLVGPEGRVYGCDIQPEAIAATKARLQSAGIENTIFLRHPHGVFLSTMTNSAEETVTAVMFNLGYLPGGKKWITTAAEETVKAIESAVRLLRPGGRMTIIAYVGHPGGLEEATAVEDRLSEMVESNIVTSISWPEIQPDSLQPRLYAIEKHQPANPHVTSHT